MVAAVILVVVKGPDTGREVTIGPGHCAMIGRSPLVGQQASRRTGMLNVELQQRLHIEDHDAVERHLQTRRAGLDHDAFDSFERDVDVTLDDEAVSAAHAMIFCDAAGPSLLDLGSTNGTFVNGEAATSADLIDGDLVRVGETRLTVKLAPPPTAATTAHARGRR